VALERSRRVDAKRQLCGLAADPVNPSWLNAQAMASADEKTPPKETTL
jgi:hypothetical protein